MLRELFRLVHTPWYCIRYWKGKDGPQSSQREGPEETEAVRASGEASRQQADRPGGRGWVSDLDSMSPAWTGCILRSLQSRGFLGEKSPHWATLSSSAGSVWHFTLLRCQWEIRILPLISRTVCNSVFALICSSTNSPDHQSIQNTYVSSTMFKNIKNRAFRDFHIESNEKGRTEQIF